MKRIYAYNKDSFAINESRAEKPVTKENETYVANKVKKLSGVKVCFDENGNMRKCDDNKLIMRSALNGKRSIEDLVEAAKKVAECSECNCGKAVKKDKKPVKESLCAIFDKEDDENDGTVVIKESVSSRFAKYRKLYEDEDLSEKEDEDEKDAEDDSLNFDDMFGDNADGDKEDKGEEGDEKNDDEEGDEEIPITAVVITIKDKEKVDDFKDQLVDAGISEDDIDIIDGDDDDKEAKVRIDVNAFDELKTFLKDKYDKDLEEELGGEIVSDDDDEEDDEKEEKKDDEDGDKGEGDDDFNFDDIDMFGDEGDNGDEEK